ncbi:MAG: hypothetical protein U1E51_23300 [Candidatus Binatia bacterium]|nr:hypothetical protein [Candidatus Binatia bacterium]
MAKFSNLGLPGMARRFGKPKPLKPKKAKAKPQARPAKRFQKWRDANRELYLERQREYQRDYRKRRKGKDFKCT